MKERIATLVHRVHRDEPGAVGAVLDDPRIRAIVRIRAAKMKPFPWERIADRQRDAQRAVWEVSRTIDERKVAKLRTDGVTLAYLSSSVRNRMFRQTRTDLGLREAMVVDDFGERRFQLVSKMVRAPFDLAVAQINPMADPCKIVIEKESMLEVVKAFKTAPMVPGARAVLRW